jgi:hypothetical protein
MPDDLPAYQLVNILTISLVDATRKHNHHEHILNIICFLIHAPAIWCSKHGYDLWDVIRQKMEYNRSRPKLHGRAY